MEQVCLFSSKVDVQNKSYIIKSADSFTAAGLVRRGKIISLMWYFIVLIEEALSGFLSDKASSDLLQPAFYYGINY